MEATVKAPVGRLGGKIALLTGGARGIGRAIALRMAAEGARLAIGDIDAAGATQTADQITVHGGQARAYALDVTDFDQVGSVVRRIESELGPLDILVNNAGWDKFESFVNSTPATWDRVIAINYRGVINCCKAVLTSMQARGQGKIVSISSDAGRVGSSGEAVYSGCKAAIIGFSKTLARELARDHINVNVVCPGPTDTALLRSAGEATVQALARAIPMRRLGTPEDVTGAVVFFASADADFATGQVLSVSGGLTMNG